MMKLVIGLVLSLRLISVGEAGSRGYARSSSSHSGLRSFHTGQSSSHGGRRGWSSYSSSYPGIGIYGAPSHGIVCSRGLIIPRTSDRVEVEFSGIAYCVHPEAEDASATARVARQRRRSNLMKP